MKRFPLIIFATFLSLTAAEAQKSADKPGGRPALVVTAVVNGLDYDRLTELREYFGPDGFNRLLSGSTVITDLDYGSHLDDVASSAVIFTGASPAVNGITGRELFDASTRLPIPIFTDRAYIGNFTDETFSPEAIRVSTLGDEARLDAGGLGAVYSIAPSAEQALIGAGHAGNSAAWITDHPGRWATTTYYKDLPMAMQMANRSRALSTRLDTLSWVPSPRNGLYSSLPSYKQIYQFRHSYPASDPRRVVAFKEAAPVNQEVTDLAIDYINQFNLGGREPIDFLALTYTVQPYTFSTDPDVRAETIDAYIKLDLQLARLLKAIDAKLPSGAEAAIAIVGTPVRPTSPRDDEKWGIPSGVFSPERAVSLMKMNYMTIYGNGDWVLGYHNHQFYLNRDLIKERGLNLEEVSREGADFLRKMSGVAYATTLRELVTAPQSEVTTFPIARNIDVDTAGDIFIAVTPGWSINAGADSGRSVAQVERATPATSMAVIKAPGVASAVITTPVDARTIAPTIARIGRLRAPNAAALPPIR